MKTFIDILNESSKEDKDLSNIPSLYQKQLAPFESVITTAYVDDKTMQTIVYILPSANIDNIKKVLDKTNIVSVTATSSDIKLILK